MQYGVVSASSPLPLTTAGQHRLFNRCWAPMVVGGLQSLTPPPPFRKALSTVQVDRDWYTTYKSCDSRPHRASPLPASASINAVASAAYTDDSLYVVWRCFLGFKFKNSFGVLRDARWSEQDASILVPGDIISIKLGDIIPADARLLEGDPFKVDQSALNGESLPVTKSPSDEVFSGSTCKQGEIEAVVIATGVHTFLPTRMRSSCYPA